MELSGNRLVLPTSGGRLQVELVLESIDALVLNARLQIRTSIYKDVPGDEVEFVRDYVVTSVGSLRVERDRLRALKGVLSAWAEGGGVGAVDLLASRRESVFFELLSDDPGFVVGPGNAVLVVAVEMPPLVSAVFKSRFDVSCADAFVGQASDLGV